MGTALMACSPAPGLVIEAAEGKKRGWLSSGIVGDQNHKYGFHVCSPASQDYSLQGALNRPACYCACAYDMQTRNTGSRNYVGSVFERIRAGVIEPTTAEFIGSSNGRDVWYWNWKQGRTVERYRGAGHDLWCHRACFRSAATKQLGWLAKYDANGRLITPSTEDDMEPNTKVPRPSNIPPYLGTPPNEYQPDVAYLMHGTYFHLTSLSKQVLAAIAKEETRDAVSAAALTAMGVAMDRLLAAVEGSEPLPEGEIQRIVSERLDQELERVMPEIEARNEQRLDEIGQFIMSVGDEPADPTPTAAGTGAQPS